MTYLWWDRTHRAWCVLENGALQHAANVRIVGQARTRRRGADPVPVGSLPDGWIEADGVELLSE